MTQIRTKKLYERAPGEPVQGDLIDEVVREIVSMVNGGLDVENVRRGVRFSVSNPGGAGIVATAWLEPFSILTMKGYPTTGDTDVVLGITPTVASGIVLVTYRASAVLDSGTNSPCTGDVVLSDIAGTLATIPLTENADGFSSKSGPLRKGAVKNFPKSNAAQNSSIVATLPAAAVLGGKSCVSVSFRILHVV